jgi:anti-sigma regulatory factor (Ser/Thr protein kinase)
VGWPFQSQLRLIALPSAVPCARLQSREILWEWGLKQVVENAELVVSELITNAVRASGPIPETKAAPGVGLRLEANERGSLVVRTWDGHPDPPLKAEVGEDAGSGRGLLIVEALCDDWGWYWPGGGTNGKWVWAAIVS